MIGARLTTAVALLAMSVVANAAQDKKLVCHVGNEAGPANETYLDDPNCIPSDLNGYFCPDAGKIDLIVVAENAAGNHLENPSHYWDGISDYDPIAMGASADVTEDIDGDGIDEGCEIAEGCPCWDAAELMQVTAANHGGGSGSFPSCSDVSFLPFLAVIQDNVTVEDGVEGGFAATRLSDGGICETRDNQVFFELSVEEASACVEQIADRCAAIGDPINNPN